MTLTHQLETTLPIRSERLLTPKTAIAIPAITQAYRHLHFRLKSRSVQGSTGAPGILMAFNGDNQPDNYRREAVTITTGVMHAFGGTSMLMGFTTEAGQQGEMFAFLEAWIFNYGRSDLEKPLFSDCVFMLPGQGVSHSLFARTWHDTAPITNIALTLAAGAQFAPGSYWELRGIR
jgi:hypothetical protein